MKKQRTQDTITFFINLVLIGILGLIFYWFWHQFYRDIVYFYQKGNWLLLFVFVCSLSYLNYLYGGFKLGIYRISDLIFSNAISLLFSNIFIYIIASFVEKKFIPMNGFCYILIVEIIVMFIFMMVINKILPIIFSAKDTVVVFEEYSEELQRKLVQYQKKMFEIKKIVHIDELDFDKEVCLYDCIMLYGVSLEKKNNLLNKCYCNSISVYIIPCIYDVLLNNAKIAYLIDTPIFIANNFGSTQLSKIVKRVFDIIFSFTLLIILFPLMIIIALSIKLYDNGPIIYKQQRLTTYGKNFNVYKFRSMKVDAEKIGGVQLAKENDSRITKVGKFIRATRIDELPQMLNILKGDMSVVGPRPERPEIASKIYDELPEFEYRLKMKAGLTGYAQVYGKYNTKLKDKLLLDLIYIENYSLLLDIKIILLTIKIVFKKDSTEGI